MKLFSTLNLFVGVAAFTAVASTSFAARTCAEDRPGLIEASETLKADIERLDETLHDNAAATRVIQIIHHFEEGIMDFSDELRRGVNCQEAIEVFQHFHEDIQEIYSELSQRPNLFYRSDVLNAWNRLLPSYVRFQNRLYW